MKRAADLVLGTVLAVLTTPLMVVLALVSVVGHRSWPVFTQTRIGQYGQPFTIVKIRTLPQGVHGYRLKTDSDDSHLAPVCRLLRTSHLDELPQLWLVPLGKMSLVGPRPRMPDEFEPVDPIYDHVRTRVPQGCTGLWQVSAHTSALPSDAPEYAFHYVREGGFRLDAWILGRTLLTMMGIGHPPRLDQIPRWTRGPGWVWIDPVVRS